jgi:Notch-like protein
MNLSLSKGTVPDMMKISKTIPIYKSGDEHSLNNYRPISLLPTFSKILEKLMYKRLVNFLEKKKLIQTPIWL